MLSEDDISQQQLLLATYRANLAHLLIQAAQFGGELSTPLPIINNVREARENIYRIKEVLRANGVAIEDHPDDIPPIRRELDQAIQKQATPVSDSERSQVLRRTQFAASVLQGAQILWVDDHPHNNIFERRIFRSLGVFVDLAYSTEEAIEMLDYTKYDAVISDIERHGLMDEGVNLLKEMRKKNLDCWTVFYTSSQVAAKRTPPSVFGVTARPDHLLHLIIDILERERI